MSCVKVEVAVLGSPSVICPIASVDIKHAALKWLGGREGMGGGGGGDQDSELRSSMKVEVAVLGS